MLEVITPTRNAVDEERTRKKRPLTWLDILPLIVGFGFAIAVWSAGILWVVYR